jgi:hypothetical protein
MYINTLGVIQNPTTIGNSLAQKNFKPSQILSNDF